MAETSPSQSVCADFEDCARLGDVDGDYTYMTLNESKAVGDNYRHACHGMIFATSQKILWGLVPVRACVLMGMRFDGVLGFPGGLVDSGEDLVTALNREMKEEIGLDVSRHGFTEEDHVETAIHQGKKLVLHFFVKEVTEEEFCAIEKSHMAAEEFGIESLGSVRVPLYTMPDRLRGFPAFLANQFIGNARHQLLRGLSHCKLLTAAEIQTGLDQSDRYMAKAPLCGKKEQSDGETASRL